MRGWEAKNIFLGKGGKSWWGAGLKTKKEFGFGYGNFFTNLSVSLLSEAKILKKTFLMPILGIHLPLITFIRTVYL